MRRSSAAVSYDVIAVAPKRRGWRRATSRLAVLVPGVAIAVLLGGCSDTESPGAGAREVVAHWNKVAVDASGLDHTPVAAGDPRKFGEQVGPGRAARAMAIVHIAMFDALNATTGGYQGYALTTAAPALTSARAAVAVAAHDALVALYPSQVATFDRELADGLAAIGEGGGKTRGQDLGHEAAAAVLALRDGDGSAHPEPRVGVDWFTSDAPGHWRQDPVSKHPLALGAHWGKVAPFALTSGTQFRCPAPPALNSPEYAAAYNEVKTMGGDGYHSSSARNADQTRMGVYWAYDGTPALCAPPRLYNQVAMQLADQRGLSGLELARLLALLNVAMADAGIAGWESKYFYDYWRPVTGMREADAGTGPTGLGDSNPATKGDPAYMPMGAPASNLNGPNFTPPFPSYPSGHATFGGAVFQVMRRFFGSDEIPFTFTSDEYNGQTWDNHGVLRPLEPRTFQSLSQAEEENGQSRIYLGIHWAFDKTAGIAQGRQVGDWVFDHTFQER